MLVLHRAGDDPWGWRGHERLDEMRPGVARRGPEVGTFGFDRLCTQIADFADRLWRPHVADRLLGGELLLHHPLECRIAQRVGARPALPRAAKAAHAVLNVEEETLALLLAVVADVDPRLGLLAQDRAQRLLADPFDLGGVDRFSFRSAHIEAGQLGWARQAAGMCCQDAVFAAAHCHSFWLNSWVFLSVARKQGAANAAIENKIACRVAVFFVGWCPSSQQLKGGDPVSSHQPRSSAAATRIPAQLEVLA